MKNNFKKFTYIFFICLIIFIYPIQVFALNDIDMNIIENENSNTSISSNIIKKNNTLNTEEQIDTNFNTTPQVQVTTTQNAKTGLSFEGYASVILIAIGIVLIFLAIAILIRCK